MNMNRESSRLYSVFVCSVESKVYILVLVYNCLMGFVIVLMI